VYEKTALFQPKKEDSKSLFDFEDRLGEIKHFKTLVENTDAFLRHFNDQLDHYLSQRVGGGAASAAPPTPPSQLTPYIAIHPDTDCLGREADLKRLDDAMARPARAVVVWAMGGTGKTTLAKAWLQRVKDRYKHWAWIEIARQDDQTDRSSRLVDAIAWHPELAEHLGLRLEDVKEPEERFRRVMTALRRLDGPNLLVIDNAGDEVAHPSILAQLPLPPQWHVLLTSRSRLNGCDIVTLNQLKPEDAAKLFRRYYERNCTNAEVDALLQEVQYHTLTVELIAKTLREHFKRLSLSEMTDKLRRRQLADPDLQRRIAIHHSREEVEVYNHLLVTFQCTDLGEAERLLLARMAALPPGGAYSAEELEEWFKLEPAERRALHETLRALERKGWLNGSDDGLFSLHRMVQQAVLYQLRPGEAALQPLLEAFTQKIAFNVGTNFAQLFRWIPFGEHILDVLPEEERKRKAVSDLMNNLGIVLKEAGRYERARVLLEQALAVWLKTLGEEHPYVAMARKRLEALGGAD